MKTSKSTIPKKRVNFILQPKGGCGKSVLMFLLAEKYRDAFLLDMDDENDTTSKQLAYREPRPYTFKASDNAIDRGIVNDFFEGIASSEKTHFIADLGGGISGQMPYYFEETGEVLSEFLESTDIVLELFVVIGGSNIFKQTMQNLNELVTAVNKRFTIKIFKNNYFLFTEDQNNYLKEYTNLQNLQIIEFDINSAKNESTKNRIIEVLKSGLGVDGANFLSKSLFKKSIEQLNID